MSEQSIQTSIIKFMRDSGWMVYNTTKITPSGYPDLICHKDTETLLIEVKDIKGKLSRVQEEVHKRLKEQGINVIVAKSKEDVIESYIKRNL